MVGNLIYYRPECLNMQATPFHGALVVFYPSSISAIEFSRQWQLNQIRWQCSRASLQRFLTIQRRCTQEHRVCPSHALMKSIALICILTATLISVLISSSNFRSDVLHFPTLFHFPSVWSVWFYIFTFILLRKYPYYNWHDINRTQYPYWCDKAWMGSYLWK